MFDVYGGRVAQNGGQPCYLARGAPPSDPSRACPKARQKQPTFDGRQSFYSSGIIDAEGIQPNVFRVTIAPDTPPGTYTYICLVHLPNMRGTLEVVDPSKPLPSSTEAAKRAPGVQRAGAALA